MARYLRNQQENKPTKNKKKNINTSSNSSTTIDKAMLSVHERVTLVSTQGGSDKRRHNMQKEPGTVADCQLRQEGLQVVHD